MANITIDQKKQARLEEWNSWLSKFEEYLKEDIQVLEPIPNAASLLNDYYWRLAIIFIRPLLQEGTDSKEDHNIHYYKIISASELTVMAVLPWRYKEDYPHKKEDRAKLNAEFAFFIAISIMLNWKIHGKEVIEEHVLAQVTGFLETIDISEDGTKKLYPENFTEEHINWLASLNINAPLPILSNSHTWRMCSHACMAIHNNGKLEDL